MAKTSIVVIDPARLQDIAKSIYDTLAPLGGLATEKSGAKEAFDASVKAETQGREGIIRSLADLAMAKGWTLAEVNGAAGRVAKMASTATAEKAIATFIGDAKAAMHPDVRAYVTKFVAVRDAVWDAEAADKDGPQPARKAFKRSYHMLKSMMVAARDDKRYITTYSDAVEWAHECDPDLDPDRVHGRLQSLIEDVQAFAKDFPVNTFSDIVEFMQAITPAALKAARDGLIQEQTAVTEAHRLAPVPPVLTQPATVVAEPTAPVEPVEPEPEIFVDPVDAYFAEQDGDMLMAAD